MPWHGLAVPDSRVATGTSIATEKHSRRDYRDSTPRVQRSQIVIAAHYAVALGVEGQRKESIVLGIPAICDLREDGNQRCYLQNAAQEFLSVRSGHVFVELAPCQYVREFFYQWTRHDDLMAVQRLVDGPGSHGV